MTELTKIHH